MICEYCVHYQKTRVVTLGLCLHNRDTCNCSSLVDADTAACSMFKISDIELDRVGCLRQMENPRAGRPVA